MNWQYSYIFIIFASTAISIAIAIYAWNHRGKTGALCYGGMMLAVSEWLFTSAMVSISATQQQASFWVAPRYFGLTVMLAFFICFALQYTGHEKWLTKRLYRIILSIPILTQIIIQTNPLHHLWIKDLIFSKDGILMGLDAVHYGPLFWPHTVYSYILVLTGISLIVWRALRTFHIYREQATLMILGIIPPLLTSITDAFLLIPKLKHPLAPLGFAFMGTCFAWSMFKHRMLNIVPVARDNVIECMHDAMFVLDTNFYVVDVNPAALDLLRLDSSQVIGRTSAEIFQPWEEVFLQWHGKLVDQTEIHLETGGKQTFFDLCISPLQDPRGVVRGRIIILRNITIYKETQHKLQESLNTVRSLQAQLYEQTIHDPLTGLHNRRFLDEIIPFQINQAKRDKQPVSFLLMDLDHFKVLNDKYGHDMGDLMLKHVAKILKENTRANDYAFRYGGEEFLAILPATHPQDALHFAERWHQKLQEHNIHSNGEKIIATISIGIAAYMPDQPETENALINADTAMYQAKGQGRNCTVVYQAEN